MASTFKNFNAKILLFGEHLVNLGSDALSIPYEKFSGKLIKTDSLDSRLNPFLDFLKSSQFDFLDNTKLSKVSGLEFSSNIPEGYGCGSSGAIVSACYAHFRTDDVNDSKVLKNRFSMMEAFYHGKSSGTDPLISYFNSPIKFNADSNIQKLPELNFTLEEYSLILVDSGHSREGKKYIKWFMNNCEDEEFKSILTKELLPASQTCISTLLKNDEDNFKNSFEIISRFQLEHMDKMIPEHMKKLWIKGFESGKLYLKVCGAGGGGFFIGLLKKNTGATLLEAFKTYSLD